MVFLVFVSPSGAELEDGIEVGGWATKDVTLVASGWVKFAGMELWSLLMANFWSLLRAIYLTKRVTLK